VPLDAFWPIFINLSFSKQLLKRKEQAGSVAHPSFLEGKDQGNLGSKPGQANSFQDSISKHTQHKTRLVE
jgi:hypothetical protein